ncbi:MAG: hypothetical protein ACPL1B_09615 [Thermoprotei archaeon]
MPYKNKPFNYFGASPYQVRIDLEAANLNFDILANAFINNTPDAGIVKQADTLDGFHASQIPQPNTIPASDRNGKIRSDWLYASQLSNPNFIPVANSKGKIDISWLPDNIGNIAFDFSPSIISPVYDGNVAVANGDFKGSNEIIVRFSNAIAILLNIPMPDNSVIDMQVVLDPVVNVPQSTSYTDFILYPNGITNSQGLFTNNKNGFYVDYLLDVNRRVFLSSKIVYSGDKRFCDFVMVVLSGYYINVYNNLYVILNKPNPLTRDITSFSVYNYSSTSAWIPYTPDGQLIPWNTLGLLSWSPYIMNGYIYLKKGMI